MFFHYSLISSFDQFMNYILHFQRNNFFENVNLHKIMRNIGQYKKTSRKDVEY